MGDGMPIVETDERGRVVIPKQIRKIVEIKPKEHLLLKLSDKDTIILKKLKTTSKEKDPLISSIKNPAHVPLKKIEEINLEKIEEEMWSS